MSQITLGPFAGRYAPDYALRFWHDGDPRKVVRNVNLRSVVAIQTSKSLNDFSGTFTITLKDKRARHFIKEMDVVRIRLRGHDGHGLETVMKGVVDTVRQGGSADTYASREDTVIEGRDLGKYLQITSLFLPVWDPEGLLPTALIFGIGDAAKKVGGNTPYDIFNYLVKRFTWGSRRLAGVSGVPNSRFWLDHKSRFDKVPFQVPFLQFDEDAMSDALKRLEVLGYTEAWVDEVGRVVYRHPQWDQPAKFRIPTASLQSWDFPRTDVGASTYFEVIPAGDPGIDSAAAQALRAGRAPVPSSYLSGHDTSQFNVRQEFIIDTDSAGKVTAKGRRNYWYRLQRRLGLRPQQITSPLLFTQEQAQAQAEGLLQFFSRMQKTTQLTIPGCPVVRLGENARVVGPLEGQRIDRTYYLDQVSHEYVEDRDGGHYTTSLHGSHGRDPWDPRWGKIAIPKFDPAKLALEGGVLDADDILAGVTGLSLDAAAKGGARKIVEAAVSIAAQFGDKVYVASDYRPGSTTTSGNPSDHSQNNATRAARDIGHRGTDALTGPPTHDLDKACVAIGAAFGRKYKLGATVDADQFHWHGFQVEIIWRTPKYGGHMGHIHVGAHRV